MLSNSPRSYKNNKYDSPLVSFIIVARNASKFLSNILADLVCQDYPEDKIEIILVDGDSTDTTRRIMEDFAKTYKERKIIILENSRKILSCGWNTALTEANGDIIIRVDAHSSIQPDFINKNVANILSGENIVGGPRISSFPTGSVPQLISLAERSRFGCGIADFRNLGPPRHVDTLAHAAYQRSVFEKVGGLDERLVRNQDNEIHYRMKQAGFKFFFDPEIKSLHFSRSRLHDLLRQKYGNGLWVGRAMGIQPRCFGIRHFTPAFFVGALAIGIILGAKDFWLPLILLSILYSFSACVFTIVAICKAPLKMKPFCFFLPLLFLLIHLSYGIGTLIGLVKMPFFLMNSKDYKIPRPISKCN